MVTESLIAILVELNIYCCNLYSRLGLVKLTATSFLLVQGRPVILNGRAILFTEKKVNFVFKFNMAFPASVTHQLPPDPYSQTQASTN